MQKTVFQKQPPPNMPGPQFGQKKKENWWSQNYRRVIPSLIIILVSIGGYYFYQNYSNRQELLKPAIEEMNKANLAQKSNSQLITPAVKPASTKNESLSQSAIPEIQKNGSEITASAAKGNGKTHLARQALKEYLKDKPELKSKLRAEQLIFIEDYLQKQVTDVSVLEIGDQITFSENTFQSAIDSALNLSNAQLKNLSKYVLLVPSLLNG